MATAILIDDLYIAYQALAENCLRARRAIVADASYPLVVPNFGLKRTDWTTPAARLAAAESMTRLFFLSEGDVHYKG